MGRHYNYLLKGIAALGLVILAAACQKGNNNKNTNYGNACGVGYAYTQYGCLPQGNCPAGTGSYNGQCVAAIQNNGLNGCSYYGQQYGGGYYGNGYNNGYNNQYCNQYGYQQQYPYYQQYGSPYYNNYGYYPYGTYRGGAYFRFGWGF